MTLATDKSNIKIVDDTPENLIVLRQMLKEHSYRVRPVLLIYALPVNDWHYFTGNSFF